MYNFILLPSSPKRFCVRYLESAPPFKRTTRVCLPQSFLSQRIDSKHFFFCAYFQFLPFPNRFINECIQQNSTHLPKTRPSTFSLPISFRIAISLFPFNSRAPPIRRFPFFPEAGKNSTRARDPEYTGAPWLPRRVPARSDCARSRNSWKEYEFAPWKRRGRTCLLLEEQQCML